jgi:hypothetical protein
MLILEECRLAMPKENSVELACVNAGENQIGD